MIIFNLVDASFETKPSEADSFLFCVADAGIESTPFGREGRAMVTRGAGAGDVMTVEILVSHRGRESAYLLFVKHLGSSYSCRPQRNLSG